MKLSIDTEAKIVTVADSCGTKSLPLHSADAFVVLSDLWLKVGWSLKYSYGYSWLGRPVIQLPEDLIRVQEVLHRLQPDVVIETGVAHGGSLIFYASLFKAMDRGRVIGVDIDIRPHNRAAIESHPLSSLVTLVEGDSAAPEVVARVKGELRSDESVLVLLDSNHSCAHVARELEAYAPLVTPGSYLVVTDGVMRNLGEVPGGRPEWAEDNPLTATAEFLARHPEFRREEPVPPFDERAARPAVTYWPEGWLRRV
jgi:cephalosporin hydroxylase